MTANHFYKYWLPVYAWAVTIFILSHLPYMGPQIFIHQDKLLHLIEYAILSILLARAFRNSAANIKLSGCCMIAAAISAAYGLSDEIHQLFVSYRDFSLADLAFDAMGSVLGALIYNKREAL